MTNGNPQPVATATLPTGPCQDCQALTPAICSSCGWSTCTWCTDGNRCGDRVCYECHVYRCTDWRCGK